MSRIGIIGTMLIHAAPYMDSIRIEKNLNNNGIPASYNKRSKKRRKRK